MALPVKSSMLEESIFGGAASEAASSSSSKGLSTLDSLQGRHGHISLWLCESKPHICQPLLNFFQDVDLRLGSDADKGMERAPQQKHALTLGVKERRHPPVQGRERAFQFWRSPRLLEVRLLVPLLQLECQLRYLWGRSSLKLLNEARHRKLLTRPA